MMTIKGVVSFVADTLPEYEIIKQKALAQPAATVVAVEYDAGTMTVKITLDGMSDVSS